MRLINIITRMEIHVENVIEEYGEALREREPFGNEKIEEGGRESRQTKENNERYR